MSGYPTSVLGATAHKKLYTHKFVSNNTVKNKPFSSKSSNLDQTKHKMSYPNPTAHTLRIPMYKPLLEIHSLRWKKTCLKENDKRLAMLWKMIKQEVWALLREIKSTNGWAPLSCCQGLCVTLTMVFFSENFNWPYTDI